MGFWVQAERRARAFNVVWRAYSGGNPYTPSPQPRARLMPTYHYTEHNLEDIEEYLERLEGLRSELDKIKTAMRQKRCKSIWITHTDQFVQSLDRCDSFILASRRAFTERKERASREFQREQKSKGALFRR